MQTDPSISPYPALPNPPSWLERNWKWFIPVTLIGVIGFMAVFVGAIVTLVFGMIKSSDPYKDAVVIAKASPVIQERLGEPVREGFFVMGNIHVSGSGGEASLSIPLSGPKGKVTIFVEGERSMGKWEYSDLIAQFEDSGERVSIKP